MDDIHSDNRKKNWEHQIVMLKVDDLIEFLALVNFNSRKNPTLHSLRSEIRKKMRKNSLLLLRWKM